MAKSAKRAGAAGAPLPAVAGALLRYQIGTAPGRPEREKEPVFFLATATGKLTAAAAAAVAAEGLPEVTVHDFRNAIILALEEARTSENPDVRLAEPDYQSSKATFEAFVELKAWSVEKDGPLPWERRVLFAAFSRLERWAAAWSPYYRELELQDASNRERRNFIMCQYAVRGWERHDGACVVDGDHATAESVEHLLPGERAAIVMHWVVSQVLSDEQKKTSDSPSSSSSNPTASPSAPAAPPMEAPGSSATTSTTKTPAS